MNQESKIPQDKSEKLFVERDVLGLDKSSINNPKSMMNPTRILFAIALIVAVALVYWWYKHS